MNRYTTASKNFSSRVSDTCQEIRTAMDWIKLVLVTDLLLREQAGAILQDANGVCKIIIKKLLTMKNRITRA